MTCSFLASPRPRHLPKWVTGWAYCCHRLGARRTLRISHMTTSTPRGSPPSSMLPGLPYSEISSVHIWLLCEHTGKSFKMALFLCSSVSLQFDAEEVLRAKRLHWHAALQSSQLRWTVWWCDFHCWPRGLFSHLETQMEPQLQVVTTGPHALCTTPTFHLALTSRSQHKTQKHVAITVIPLCILFHDFRKMNWRFSVTISFSWYVRERGLVLSWRSFISYFFPWRIRIRLKKIFWTLNSEY